MQVLNKNTKVIGIAAGVAAAATGYKVFWY